MNILKQSTQIKVRVGPFVDVGDGFTPETAIGNTPTNLTGVDEAELLKANGAATVDITTATWAAITGADGWYDLTLTTSHTDTVGELVIVIQDDSVCLPVFARFQVVEEAVYDAWYGASAVGYITDQPVNTTKVGGTTQTAGDIPDLVTTVDTVVDGIQTDLSNGTDGLGALKAIMDTSGVVLTAAAVDAIWDEDLSPAHDTAGSAGKALQDAGSAGDPWSTALPGAYGAGTAGEILGDWKDAGRLDAILDTIAADVVNIDGIVPAAAGDAMTLSAGAITAAVVATGAIDADALAADAGTEIGTAVWATATRVLTANTNLNDPTAAAIADAVWDEPVAGHVSAGTFGKTDADILADTNELQTDWADAGRLDAILDELTTNVDAIETDTQDLQTQIGTAGAGLTDLGGMSTAMKAEVNAEAVDVINTDTYAEPGQGAPGATVTLAAKINYLYKAWRNKSTQTATTYSLYADDTTTVDQKATVSDDATTATKGEIATGP